jgi:hypothetical protein
MFFDIFKHDMIGLFSKMYGIVLETKSENILETIKLELRTIQLNLLKSQAHWIACMLAKLCELINSIHTLQN